VLYLNNYLKQIRDNQKLSNNDLITAIAREFNAYSLTQTAVQRLMDGFTVEPKIQSVVALCDVLGITPDEAFKLVRQSMNKPLEE
jgi:transcriptional regulator with XRE-family HTH domain